MAQIMSHHAHVQPLARFTDFVEIISVGEIVVVLEDNMLTAQIEQEELEVVIEEQGLTVIIEQEELEVVIEQDELEC